MQIETDSTSKNFLASLLSVSSLICGRMSFQPRSVGRKNKSNSSKSATPIDTTSNTERINTTSIETDTKPTTSSLPFLVPRSLSKGKKVSPRVNPTISNQVAIKVEDVEPIASTSTLLESVKLDSNESNRLELILSTLELCMSDLELSTHRSSGILDKLRDSEDGCKLNSLLFIFKFILFVYLFIYSFRRFLF